MICPKCQSAMKTVDRLGVHIDQCDGCRGIFLDRGELETILSAEQRYAAPAGPPPSYRPEPGYAAPPPPPPPTQQYGYRDSPPGYGGYRDSPPGYGHHGGHYGHKKKKRSFLEELFD